MCPSKMKFYHVDMYGEHFDRDRNRDDVKPAVTDQSFIWSSTWERPTVQHYPIPEAKISLEEIKDIVFQWPDMYDPIDEEYMDVIRGPFKIVQAVQGVGFSACLTESTSEEIKENRVICWQGSTDKDFASVSAVLRGTSFEYLDRLAFLPAIDEPIVKIAAGRGFIVALSASGMIYISGCIVFPLRNHPSSPADFFDDDSWQYVSMYCRDIKWMGNKRDGSNIFDDPDYRHLIDSRVKITDIAAFEDHIVLSNPNVGMEEASPFQALNIIADIDRMDRQIVLARLQGVQLVKIDLTPHSVETNIQYWIALTVTGQLLYWPHPMESQDATFPYSAIEPTPIKFRLTAVYENGVTIARESMFVMDFQVDKLGVWVQARDKRQYKSIASG